MTEEYIVLKRNKKMFDVIVIFLNLKLRFFDFLLEFLLGSIFVVVVCFII